MTRVTPWSYGPTNEGRSSQASALTAVGASSRPSRKDPHVAKDAIVSTDLASKFATEKDSPYTRWVADEGLDIIGAHYVPDLKSVEL